MVSCVLVKLTRRSEHTTLSLHMSFSKTSSSNIHTPTWTLLQPHLRQLVNVTKLPKNLSLDQNWSMPVPSGILDPIPIAIPILIPLEKNNVTVHDLLLMTTALPAVLREPWKTFSVTALTCTGQKFWNLITFFTENPGFVPTNVSHLGVYFWIPCTFELLPVIRVVKYSRSWTQPIR